MDMAGESGMPKMHADDPESDAQMGGESALPISEIFTSVQGESTYAGRICTFVRVAGCPLRCVWCDTEYALMAKQGTKMSLGEIIVEVEAQTAAMHRPEQEQPALVELTGGEPLMHRAVPKLAEILLARGFLVVCETAGAHPIDRLPLGVRRIMDIKCPDSGEYARNHWENLGMLREGDEIKFVIASRRDFDFALEIVRADRILAGLPIIVSPVMPIPSKPELPGVSPTDLAQWLLDAREPRIRMQIQLHKLLWPGVERGI